MKVLMRICTFFCCVGLLTSADQAICRAQQSDQDARQERARKMEAKVAELSEEFQKLKVKFNATSDQAKINIMAELSDARSELGESYDELQGVYDSNIAQYKQALNDAWKQFEAQRDDAKTAAAKDLEALRAQWNDAVAQLRRSHQERVQQIRDEMTELEKQVTAVSDEVAAEWTATRAAIRQQYEADAHEMRRTYHEYISTLRGEVNRLRTSAKNASGESKANHEKAADSLSQQMNASYEELQASCREVAAKAASYVNQMREQWQTAEGEMKQAIQDEVDAVSITMCELHAELTASYEEYHESLDQQIASAKTRGEEASADTKNQIKKMADDLRDKRDKTAKELESTYEDYVAALTSEIDRMQSQVDAAKASERAAMVEAIEKRQAELEEVKQKIENSQ